MQLNPQVMQSLVAARQAGARREAERSRAARRSRPHLVRPDRAPPDVRRQLRRRARWA